MVERVCIGRFLGAHGVHGRVKLQSFMTRPEDVFGLGPLADEQGRSYSVRRTGTGKDHFLAEIEGLKGREAADALRGMRLYVDRAKLPAPGDADEFYHADLLALEAVTADGQPFGTVVAVYDFGAGDVLELRHASGKLVQVPFTKAVVPEVDLKAGRLVVVPPAGLFEKARPEPGELEAAAAESGEGEPEMVNGPVEDPEK